MKQTLDTVWQRRGTSWVWDEEARNQVCEAGQVWSLRQFFQAVGNWPDDLPSNGNNTVVVAGLEASLDLLTPEDAEAWLGDAIKDAIVSKDKIRANLGALQNRLENTISNLQIQAENLQAAESQISDVDVATEMTQFVRNQILTQSAVAMLSQANTLPQMALQLMQG